MLNIITKTSNGSVRIIKPRRKRKMKDANNIMALIN